MASTLAEHTGLIVRSIIEKDRIMIRIKNIKNDEEGVRYTTYIFNGEDLRIDYFVLVGTDDWKATDKFNFEYREVLHHVKKDIETIYDQVDTVSGKKTVVKIPEETLTIFFRKDAIMVRKIKFC